MAGDRHAQLLTTLEESLARVRAREAQIAEEIQRDVVFMKSVPRSNVIARRVLRGNVEKCMRERDGAAQSGDVLAQSRDMLRRAAQS